jgi:hypothetical protein
MSETSGTWPLVSLNDRWRRSPHDTSRDFRHLTLFCREPRPVIAFVLPKCVDVYSLALRLRVRYSSGARAPAARARSELIP